MEKLDAKREHESGANYPLRVCNAGFGLSQGGSERSGVRPPRVGGWGPSAAVANSTNMLHGMGTGRVGMARRSSAAIQDCANTLHERDGEGGYGGSGGRRECGSCIYSLLWF